MAGSFSRVYLHLVFSTRNREILLAPEQQKAVFAYIAAILRKLGCEFVLVNGVVDHVHVICTLPVTVPLADLVRNVKGSSSRWIRDSRAGMADFGWQSRYAVFSFSRKHLDAVRRYVSNQRQHHRCKSFDEEYRELLETAAIEIDDRYLLG